MSPNIFVRLNEIVHFNYKLLFLFAESLEQTEGV